MTFNPDNPREHEEWKAKQILKNKLDDTYKALVEVEKTIALAIKINVEDSLESEWYQELLEAKGMLSNSLNKLDREIEYG